MSDPDATADWLLSTQGRLARIAAGTLLILIGLGVVGGFLGVILLLIGAVPIASAAYGALLVGPLLGRDTMGRRPEDQPEDKQDETRSPTTRRATSPTTSDLLRRPDADPDWSAPPLATAERPAGQEPRTRDLRAGRTRSRARAVSELSAFRDRYGVPAVGSALITPDGAVEMDLIGGRVGRPPVGAGDAWHIGSCGKAMTAALYARLVERGEAEWGVPVTGLFADLGADPGWRAVTVDDLFVGESATRRPQPLGDGAGVRHLRPLPPSAPRSPPGRSRVSLAGPGASATRTSATSSSAPRSSGSPAPPTRTPSRRTCSSRSASPPPGSGTRRSAATARARPRRPTTRAPTTRRSWARPGASTSGSGTGPASRQVFLIEGGGFLDRQRRAAAHAGQGAVTRLGACRRLDGPAGLEHVLGRHRADRPAARVHRDGGVQRREAASARGDREACRPPPAGLDHRGVPAPNSI